MNELKSRIDDVDKILNSNIAKYEKIVQACNRLTGLDITNMSESKKNRFYEHLNEMNSIMSHYKLIIKTWDDYQFISDKHLEKMLTSLRRLCRTLLSN